MSDVPANGDFNGQISRERERAHHSTPTFTPPLPNMTDSSSESPSNSPFIINNDKNEEEVPEIPIEIVSEEEMALIEAAFALATTTASRSSLSSASISSPTRLFRKNARSIESISFLSKKRLSVRSESSSSGGVADIEDSGDFASTQKRVRVNQSLLHRFRRKKGLSVTDITATEWCEKQMEFVLLLGKPKATKAMKAGSARHAKLEEEVVKKVKVRVKSVEDRWALKFLNFIVGANQLLFEGLTRELPIIGFAEGVWMVGVIDEIRMSVNDSERNLILVDTKTRARDTLPAEPQQRNGRLQLMCYKYLWDKLVADNFPSQQFFDFFGLNPHFILSEEIRESTANSGFPAKTLDDVVRYFRNTCGMLPMADDQLLLRYEFQKDHSLLGEDQFSYNSDWLKNQIDCSLEFWMGAREANYTPEEERWKCRFCKFASTCPTNTSTSSTPS